GRYFIPKTGKLVRYLRQPFAPIDIDADRFCFVPSRFSSCMHERIPGKANASFEETSAIHESLFRFATATNSSGQGRCRFTKLFRDSTFVFLQYMARPFGK